MVEINHKNGLSLTDEYITINQGEGAIYMSEREYNEIQFDALREMGNIGAGNACTVLSEFLNKPVNMSVPYVHFLNYSATEENLGGSGNLVIAIAVEIVGDLNGVMYHILEREFAETVINTFFPRELSNLNEIDEMDKSVLNEMANITSGMYANTLATMLDMFVNIDTPQQYVNTVGEILKMPAEHFSKLGDKVLFVNEIFTIGDKQVKNNVILILEKESLDKLFQTFGI